MEQVREVPEMEIKRQPMIRIWIDTERKIASFHS